MVSISDSSIAAAKRADGARLVWVCAALSAAVLASPAQAETYLGFGLGGQFGVRGTNMSAKEDLNYTASPSAKYDATASDVTMSASLIANLKVGYYFESIQGLGFELEAGYSRPNFVRQDITIALKNKVIGGSSRFTEDQLPANFHMLTGGFNILYRFEPIGGFRPYVGAGPAIYGLFIDGTGDSCHIVAPASLTRGFCPGGKMSSSGFGVGATAKVGVEYALTRNVSLDAEYKFSYGRFDVDWFRSLSDIRLDYRANSLTAGLRYRF